MSTKTSVLLVLLATVTLPASGPATTARGGSPKVSAVSPGAAQEQPSTVDRCPTFSWTLSRSQQSVEIAVYEKTESDWRPQPVLSRTLPPATSTWTPSKEECLRRGRTYAWAVRPIDSDLIGEFFSAPLFFQTESVSETDLFAAVEVIEAWRASEAARGSSESQRARSASSVSSESSESDRPRRRRTSRRSRIRSAGSGGAGPIAAIRGASTTTGAAAVGVEGSSTSTDAGSAGVLASSSAPSGEVSGLHARHQSPDGVAARLEAPAGGRLITGAGPAGEVLVIDSSGLLTANALAGDGSNLTSVDAASLGGLVPTDLAPAVHVHAAADIVSGTLAEERIDPLVTRDDEVMPIVLANDGRGSTLDADTLDGLEASDFVNNNQSCPPGQVVQGLDSDGGLLCGLPILPIETHAIVDDTNDILPGTLAVDANGLPWLTYKRSSDLEVVLVRCHNVYCSSSTKTVIGNGRLPAMTFQQTAGGFPAITYTQETTGELLLLLCEDPDCTTFQEIVIADLSGNSLFTAPVAIGTSALPVVAFYDGASGTGQLRIAICTTPQCSSLSTRTLQSGGNTGRSPFLAIASTGFAVIAYEDQTAARLELTRCLDDFCLTSTTRAISGASNGLNPAMVLDPLDRPTVSYYDGINFELKVAACADVACMSASDETLTSSGPSGAGRFSTIIHSPADGNPVIAFEDGVFLSLADCNTPSCSAALIDQRFRLSAPGEGKPSMQLGTDGIPMIAYGNENGQALLRCQGPEC